MDLIARVAETHDVSSDAIRDARSVAFDESTHTAAFKDARHKSRTLQSSLETIFLDWSLLAPLARKLLIF